MNNTYSLQHMTPTAPDVRDVAGAVVSLILDRLPAAHHGEALRAAQEIMYEQARARMDAIEQEAAEARAYFEMIANIPSAPTPKDPARRG